MFQGNALFDNSCQLQIRLIIPEQSLFGVAGQWEAGCQSRGRGSRSGREHSAESLRK
jgi:hypothetical protein